jgi:Family of unknown function (DUF5719)
MILRRLPVLAVSVAAAAGFVVAARETPSPEGAAFASIPAPWMPSVPSGAALTSTWFCPGVPADGAEGSAGAFVLANAGPSPMHARVTLLAGPDQAVELPITVEPYSRATVDPSASVAAPFVGAMVEIDGGGGLVEQRATQAAGTSVAPCTTQPSSEWYLAEGFTAENSTEQLVLTNPYDQSAIVDVGFATAAGSRQPLEGYPVPARSVAVIDMDAIAARDEPEVAVSVVATRGEIVVGRAQLYDGGGRLGYSMTLAAPALRSQWWFANGLKGPDVTQRFSLYNPTEIDVEVTPLFLGFTSGVTVEPIAVPAREVVTFSSDGVAGLPDGRHAVVFATADSSDSIVVERAITRTIDEIPTTSVLPGATARVEGRFVPTTWTFAIGPGEPTADAIVVYNSENVVSTVAVQAVTASGVSPVPGLDEVALQPGELITISLTDTSALDTQLVVRSTSRVFVERSLPREPGAQGRSASWAVPVVG